MNNYRFTLEPYNGPKSRYQCPQCGLKHTFVRYIDTETGQHLGSHVGRCNREVNCGYHYAPKAFFADNPGAMPQDTDHRRIILPPPRPVSTIPKEVFLESLDNYRDNHLVRFLTRRLGAADTDMLVKKYFIGTSHYWDSSAVFWQIDINGKVRTGKVMLYNPADGKRIRQPQSYITWMHKVMQYEGYELQQCLFGEHLLRGNNKTVAITESEKTAMIASVYMPQFVWLAAGSLSNLSAQKCRVLDNRRVILYPDLGAYERWKEIAANIPGCSVSHVLESIAGAEERSMGLDLADYLLAA